MAQRDAAVLAATLQNIPVKQPRSLTGAADTQDAFNHFRETILMATTPVSRTTTRDGDGRSAFGSVAQRLSTETKHASKTTEFYAMVAVILGILIAAAMIKGGDSGGTDEFIARQAWLYVAIVAAAYMISRGLAKSGSREPYFDGGTNEMRDRDGR
ncbi:MAG TPA: hypothetical protein VGV90_14480 [Solirubrobacteraceae bacterium]|nr:hypothetical protein [Solirubrobacteraceae bacterium]